MFDLCSDCRTANFFREGLGLPVAEVNERFAEVQVRLWPIAFSVLACYEECPTKKKPVYKDADALRAQAGDINIVLKASDGFLCPSQTQSTISCHKTAGLLSPPGHPAPSHAARLLGVASPPPAPPIHPRFSSACNVPLYHDSFLGFHPLPPPLLRFPRPSNRAQQHNAGSRGSAAAQAGVINDRIFTLPAV